MSVVWLLIIDRKESRITVEVGQRNYRSSCLFDWINLLSSQNGLIHRYHSTLRAQNLNTKLPSGAQTSLATSPSLRCNSFSSTQSSHFDSVIAPTSSHIFLKVTELCLYALDRSMPSCILSPALSLPSNRPNTKTPASGLSSRTNRHKASRMRGRVKRCKNAPANTKPILPSNALTRSSRSSNKSAPIQCSRGSRSASRNKSKPNSRN